VNGILERYSRTAYCKSEQQAGFADAAISDENELEEVIAVARAQGIAFSCEVYIQGMITH
jgi:DNA-binding IclR family transcriptional regulator